MTFNIPDPQKQLAHLSEIADKYNFGKGGNQLAQIKNVKPIFAFDYLSFSKTKLCFNSKLIDKKKDYLKLLESLKKISCKTYNELSIDRSFHFHDVDFHDTKFSEKDFVKCLVVDVSKIDETNIPTVYQFKVFEEARIFGFFYKGVFYPVWFDRNHEVYKRK